jgi:hypothetical protein
MHYIPNDIGLADLNFNTKSGYLKQMKKTSKYAKHRLETPQQL